MVLQQVIGTMTTAQNKAAEQPGKARKRLPDNEEPVSWEVCVARISPSLQGEWFQGEEPDCKIATSQKGRLGCAAHAAISFPAVVETRQSTSSMRRVSTLSRAKQH